MFYRVSPSWRLGAWLQPDSQGIKALHGLKNLARTECRQHDDRNKSDHGGGGGGGGGREVLGGEGAATSLEAKVVCVDTASRGPTTIVTPKSQFRTCPTDHDSIGYPRMKASGESSTTKHRLLHASGPHPIPPPNDPKTNQYNQDLGLIHSTNGNHLESPNEGSSIDHQVTIHLHAQNITMFPTNETWYFTSQMLVSSSGGLILILTAQSTRNEFRMHNDY
ncbi:hypothetical protein F511_24550 [Dorcoceras hygrometricum]|uniref:Uncharacterized protein n=1 Tax=Dorcoceras hygrometricum TaxID=472368 RepID=A0A2Z7BRJ9_9LAMI|nr:hypothetical protein F511_24550 [Dorcoceras hygrometricum]